MTTPEVEPAIPPAERLTRAIATARDALPKLSEAVRALDAELGEYEPFVGDLGTAAGDSLVAAGPRESVDLVSGYATFVGENLRTLQTGFAEATGHLNTGSRAIEDAREALAALREQPEARPRAIDLDKLQRRVDELGSSYQAAAAVLADARGRVTSSQDELTAETDVGWTADRVGEVQTKVGTDVHIARAELGFTGDDVTLARANAQSATNESADLARWLQTATPGSAGSSGTAATSEQDLRHRTNQAKGPQARGPRE